MLTDAQNRRLVRAASLQALTDPVTGLGNHRALTGDLRTLLETTPPARRVLLALYDLNGFKDYNDRFGHPAGDALLERLGTRLRDVVAPAARAYRMGGDEFCVLAVVGRGRGAGAAAHARDHALTEHGRRASPSARRRARPRGARDDDGVRGAAHRRRAHVRVEAQRAQLVAAAGDRRARRAGPRARPVLALGDDRIALLAERTARELGWTRSASRRCGTPRGCTTSASSPSRRRSWRSRPARRRRARVRPDAHARGRAHREAAPALVPVGAAHPVEPRAHGTVPATRTGSRARRSRSARGSCSSATRSRR